MWLSLDQSHQIVHNVVAEIHALECECEVTFSFGCKKKHDSCFCTFPYQYVTQKWVIVSSDCSTFDDMNKVYMINICFDVKGMLKFVKITLNNI